MEAPSSSRTRGRLVSGRRTGCFRGTAAGLACETGHCEPSSGLSVGLRPSGGVKEGTTLLFMEFFTCSRHSDPPCDPSISGFPAQVANRRETVISLCHAAAATARRTPVPVSTKKPFEVNASPGLKSRQAPAPMAVNGCGNW